MFKQLFLVFNKYFSSAAWHAGSQFPNQVLTLQWELRGLTTGRPGKSPPSFFSKTFHTSKIHSMYVIKNKTPVQPPPSLRISPIAPSLTAPCGLPHLRNQHSTWCSLVPCFPWVLLSTINFCPHPVICFFCSSYIWDSSVFVCVV